MCVQADESAAAKAAKDAEQARVEMLPRLEALVQQRLQAEEETLAAEEELENQNEALGKLLSEMQVMKSRIADLAVQREAQHTTLQEIQEKEAEKTQDDNL